jgi:hypothetical protein
MISVQVKGLSIPFHALDFQEGEGKEYVFFCVWDDRLKGSERPRGPDKWSRLTRLRSVLLGERGLAQQTLEIVISGCDNQSRRRPHSVERSLKLIEVKTNGLVAYASTR